ncbi:MAG: hypothetical protein F4X45_08710 [Chloroflexi bacterium]|nr:hypothetical protein [Chloroflexota bacterium]
MYERPRGYGSLAWPPTQVQYLYLHLKEIGCRTVIVESHYIDHAFMRDDAIYYVRSLRSYPNYTKRLHFFRSSFDLARWQEIIASAGSGQFAESQRELQSNYLGYSVMRPLPEYPVGRTVLPPLEEPSRTQEHDVSFITRAHQVHLAGIPLNVIGVPFQSQDQGVSACATSALWSALDNVAFAEEVTVSSPASITEAATLYPLHEGRALPNDGLTIRQMCEAIRAAGFSPIVVRSASIGEDAFQLNGYLKSGFSPVLAVAPMENVGVGHAVCCVGFKCGAPHPQTEPGISFREQSSGLEGLYVHDDQLGPYAFATLGQLTDPDSRDVETCIALQWPDSKPATTWRLQALIVPVPQKVRLSLSELRWLGLDIAQAVGQELGSIQTILDCRFELARNYKSRMYSFDLSESGLYQGACATVLSRYVGLIEISSPEGPVLDVVVDSTESMPDSAVLACVRRSRFPADQSEFLEQLSNELGAKLIS